MTAEQTQKTFYERYEEALRTPIVRVDTPSKKFLKEVAGITGKSINTVKGWLYDRSVPEAESKQKLADYYGVSIESLFPAPTVPTPADEAR